jgi:hypothetical protein
MQIGDGPIMVGSTADFSLGFEHGHSGTTGDWVGSVLAQEGEFSATNRDIGNNEEANMYLAVDLASAGTVQFLRATSTESGYDHLEFYIDGTFQTQWSGFNTWGYSSTYSLSAGAHILRWRYDKDGSQSSGADAVYVDDIVVSGGESATVVIEGNLSVTGQKNFLHQHPTQPEKEFVYVALEGGEAGTYWRGTATLSGARTEVVLPEHFSLVTSTTGMTASVTPRAQTAGLWVEESTPTSLVVGAADPNERIQFDYIVMGIRQGHEGHEVVRDKSWRE